MQRIEHPAPWHAYWSVRLALLAAICAGIEASLPLWHGLLPPRLFALLAAIAGTGAAVGRMVKQYGLMRYLPAPDDTAPEQNSTGEDDATEKPD